MSDFKWFKKQVKAKGGKWATDDVYFTQTRDFYFADYFPEYPERSSRDDSITGAVDLRVKG